MRLLLLGIGLLSLTVVAEVPDEPNDAWYRCERDAECVASRTACSPSG
jgi:hypothetical protein